MISAIFKHTLLVTGIIAVAILPAQAQEPFLKWFNPLQYKQQFLQHHSYDSAKMQTRVGYSIYLPPGYENADNSERFPVIYWLHGRDGSETRDQFPPKNVDQAIRDKKISPVIVVYVNGGGRSWYTDSLDGKWPAETTIIKELIPHIDATWRTIASRDGRAIQGMSMGGGGALKYAFGYPELFSSVVSFAGSLRKVEHIEGDKERGEIFSVMFGGNRDYYTSEHPFTLVQNNLDRINGKLGIKMIIGSVDREVLRETNKTLHEMLENLKLKHQYQVIDGIGHDLGKLADAVQSEALQFAQQHFKKTSQ